MEIHGLELFTPRLGPPRMTTPTAPAPPPARVERVFSANMVLAGLACLAGVYLLRPILMPVSLAMLLSCLLLPSTMFIRHVLRVSQFTAAFILFLMIGAAGGYLGLLGLDHLAEFTSSVPIDLSRLNSRMGQQLTDFVRDHPVLGEFLPEPRLMVDFAERNAATVLKGLGDPASNITNLISQGLLTLILAIFFTVEQPILEPRLASVMSRTPAERSFYESLLRHLARRMRRYLVVRAGINGFFGLSVFAVLSFKGVDYAVILGVMAALANFVPYLGQVVAVVVPSVVAVAQTGAVSDMLVVGLAITTLAFLEGYLVTPIVMGRTMDLNGTTVLLSCLFWGFMWGVVGLFLATPFAAMTRLTLERFPAGRKWAMLMSVVPEFDENGEVMGGKPRQTLPSAGHESNQGPMSRKQKPR